jgi:hypothetical protein
MTTITFGLVVYVFWIVFAPFLAGSGKKVSIAHFCFTTSPLLCLAAIVFSLFGENRMRVPIIVSGLAVELAWFLIAAATM